MKLAAILATITVSGACDEPAGPEPSPLGLDFGIAAGQPGNHSAQGSLAASSAPLDGEFAIAVPDSLGGLVVVSYDRTTADLFILQVHPAAPGEYGCGAVEQGPACHGRLFENVRMEEGAVRVDGRFDLASGTLELHTVGPGEVTGTFRGRLERTDPEGGADVIDVTAGTIRVGYDGGALLNGGLTCLIGLTGASAPCPL